MSDDSSRRARDIDRAITVTALDGAHSEGQMTFEEHRLRTERAGAAVTSSDLRALTSDVSVDGGFEPRPYSSSSLNDAGTFDWMSIDHALVANLLAGVPESLGNPDAVVESLTIDNQGRSEIEFRTTPGGRIVYDFAGNPVAVYK